MTRKYLNYLLVVFILLAIFQVYLHTAFPAFNSDDSPETIVSTYTLGIGHPPSYPLFTMAGKAFSLLHLGSPAFRLNIFSCFIALIVLLLSYLIINKFALYIFGYKNQILNVFGVLVLAFSILFWSQAIEAKGGIYILNLLFLGSLIYLSLRLFEVYNSKFIYLMSYIFGLSLSNHWESTIILLPVFGYVFFKYRMRIKQNNAIYSLLFLFVGISPQLYLPIRANSIYVYAFKPNTWANFWWTVLRSGYVNDVSASLQVYCYQIKELLDLLINNYYVLWIFMIVGGYCLYKKNKEIFYYLLSVILIIVFMVIIYNKFPENMMWQTGVFLMPAFYILLLFLIMGLYYALNIFKQKILKNMIIIGTFIVILLLGYKNFLINNSRYDYQAYDFGKNILKTMEINSLFLSEGDFNVVPYIQLIEKQRLDIQLTNAMYLPLKIGMEKFSKQNIQLKENDPAYNFTNIINQYLRNNVNVYKSTISPYINKLKLNFNFVQTGLLQKCLNNDKTNFSYIYKTYSYNREFYDKYLDHTGRNLDLVMNYPFCMVNQGNDLLIKNHTDESLQLLKKATLFPLKGMMYENKAAVYYNLSKVYKNLDDKGNQTKYLKMAIESNNSFWQAYDALGMIYFKDGILPMAKEMFEKALQNGDNNFLLQTYIANIDAIDLNKQYETIFDEATSMMAKGNFTAAMNIYEFLVRNNFDVAVINKNIGVYYFKINDFSKAMEYFKKSKTASPSPDIYTFIAFGYYKLGLLDKEMTILKEGMKLYPNNQQILQLYNQLSQTKNK